MPLLHRAAWVLPIAAPPIEDGWVLVDRGRIVAAGGAGDAVPGEWRESPVREPRAILPGLVNAHTHLELSYLHRQIPEAPGFGTWVAGVMAARRQYPDPSDPAILGPARTAIDRAIAGGTAVFGDVSNTLVTVPLLRERGAAAQVFYELLGFTEPDPDGRVREARARADALSCGDVRIGLAPHAPYSVSAALFQAINRDLEAHSWARSSVHLGETIEEIELLRDGTGAIREVLESLGRWPGGWAPPGTGPVEYLDRLGVLHSRTLAVHGVRFDADDLDRLRARGTTIVSCPRSNRHVGAGSPPLAAFYDAEVPVAFGTDSLASADDLDLFGELREARRIAPRVAARRLLESATLIGAAALGFGEAFGSIAAGKRAALIGVRVPPDVVDVEEYLVSRASAADVHWLEDGAR